MHCHSPRRRRFRLSHSRNLGHRHIDTAGPLAESNEDQWGHELEDELSEVKKDKLVRLEIMVSIGQVHKSFHGWNVALVWIRKMQPYLSCTKP